MKYLHTIVLAIFGGALSTIVEIVVADAYAGSQEPIIIGGSANEDACGAVGTVAGFKNKSSTLAVRTGPGASFSVVDNLPIETLIFVCAFQGEWLGIVYGKDLSTCAVSSPQPTKLAYHGPCRSGWVHKKYIRLVAG